MLRLAGVWCCLLAFTAAAAEPTRPTSELRAPRLTPEPAAAEAPAPAASPAPAPAREPGLAQQWWLWAALGVIAVGAMTAGAVAVAWPPTRSATLGTGDLR